MSNADCYNVVKDPKWQICNWVVLDILRTWCELRAWPKLIWCERTDTPRSADRNSHL